MSQFAAVLPHVCPLLACVVVSNDAWLYCNLTCDATPRFICLLTWFARLDCIAFEWCAELSAPCCPRAWSEFSLALCCSLCLAYPPIIHIWCSLSSHTCPMIHFVSICMLSPTFLELDLPAPALACAPRFRDPLFDFYACVVRFFGRCKHTRSRQQQGRRAHVWILVGLVGIIVGKDGSHTSLVGSSQLESRLYTALLRAS